MASRRRRNPSETHRSSIASMVEWVQPNRIPGGTENDVKDVGIAIATTDWFHSSHT